MDLTARDQFKAWHRANREAAKRYGANQVWLSRHDGLGLAFASGYLLAENNGLHRLAPSRSGRLVGYPTNRATLFARFNEMDAARVKLGRTIGKHWMFIGLDSARHSRIHSAAMHEIRLATSA